MMFTAEAQSTQSKSKAKAKVEWGGAEPQPKTQPLKLRVLGVSALKGVADPSSGGSAVRLKRIICPSYL
jgi:hypothetical protein